MGRDPRTSAGPVGRERRVIPVAPWQVRWASLDPTVGNEQAGQRPVIVVSTKLHLRLFPTLVTILPLTTKARPRFLHRVQLDIPGEKTSYVITEQIRTISMSRLGSRLYDLPAQQIDEVRQVVRKMLDL